MEYNFRQELSQEEYGTFVMNHLRNGLMRPFNIVLFMFSMGYLLSSPFMPGNNGNWTFFFVAIGLLVVLGLMVLFSRRSALKRFDKIKEEFKVNFTVNEEKLVYALDDGRMLEREWAGFTRVIERGDFLYLYLNKQSAVVILTNHIDQSIVNFVKEQIRKNVPAKKVKMIENN